MKTSIKLYGLNWFKNIGSQQYCIDNRTEKDNLVVSFFTNKNGRGWTFTNQNHIFKISEKNRGLYEVLVENTPFKLYFDIDFENPPTDFKQDIFLTNVYQILNKYYPNDKYAVSGSVNEKKASFHLVSQKYIISNTNDLLEAKKIAIAIHNEIPSLDWKVYTKNRQMKLPLQSKPNKPVQEMITHTDNRKAHFITCFFNENTIKIPYIQELNDEIKPLVQSFNNLPIVSEIPTMDLPNPEHISWDDLLKPEHKEELLSLIPNDNTFSHSHTFKVACFCISNDIPIPLFITWLKKKNNDIKRVNKYINIHIPFIKKHKFKCSQYTMREYLTHFYPNIKPEQNNFIKFKEQFYPSHIEYVKKENITQDLIINNNVKTNIFSNPMGSGKTTALLNAIQKNPDKSVLYIVHRKTLSEDIYHRMKEKNINITHYDKIGNKNKKLEVLSDEQQSKNVIIVLNSLKYIVSRTFDYVIIDEIESIFNILCQKQTKFISTDDKKVIFDIFVYILQNAKKIIALDAFITKRTTSFLYNITKEEPIIYDSHRDKNPDKFIIYQKDFNTTILQICNKIFNNEKVVVFFPFKKQTEYPDMNGIINTIQTFLLEKYKYTLKNEECVYYHAEVGQNVKKDIQNVNRFWENKKLVIFNNIITAGVSYTNKTAPFDSCFLFVAPFNSPRDVAQVSARTRELTSKNIYLCYLFGKKPEVFDDDTKEINRELYTQLFNHTLIENMSPLKKTLLLFFHRANYNIKNVASDIQKEDLKNIQKMIQQYNCEVNNYDSIPQITPEDFDRYIIRSYEQHNLTSSEILQMRKLVFQSHFHNAPIEIHRKVWDEGLCNQIDCIYENNIKENNVISLLKIENGLDTIIPYIKEPTREWNFKTTKDIINRIFDECHFLKFKKDTKKINDLLKTYYNHVFQMEVIHTKEEKKQRNVYYSTPKYDEITEIIEISDKFYKK